MGGLGAPEIVIILVIALIVLGPKRLPEAGRAIGKGLREFKDSVNNIDPRPELEGEAPTPERASTKSADNAFGDEAP